MTAWGMDIPMTAWGMGYPDDSVGNGYPDDSVGNGDPVHHTKKVWEKRFSRIVIPSEVEGSFSLAARRRTLTARNGKHRIAGKAADGVSPRRLSEGVMERGDEKDFSLRSK